MNFGTSANTNSQTTFLASLSTDQYSRLVTMMQPHLQSSKVSNDDSTEITHVAGMSTLSSSLLYDSWVIYSGESTHICYNCTPFSDIRHVINMSVMLPTQSRFIVDFIGTVQLSPDLIWQDVLYVLQFTYNLLSISSLLRSTLLVFNFSDTSCKLQDRSESKQIGKVELVDGLYLLNFMLNLLMLPLF